MPKHNREKHRAKVNARVRRRKSEDPAYVAKCKAYRRERRLKKYGVSAEVFDQMALDQGYRCLICRRKTKLCIDHDHTSQVVRGLLCVNCNLGIGNFKDNPVFLKRAIKYLMED